MSANETRYGNICFDSTSDQPTYQNGAILRVHASENAYESPYQSPTQNSTWSHTTEGNENISIELEKTIRKKQGMLSKLKILSGVLFFLVAIVFVEAALLLKAYQLENTSNDVFATTLDEIITETSTPALNTDSTFTQTDTVIKTTETSTSLDSSTPLQKPRSCLNYKDAENRSSGIYKVFSEDGKHSYDVYCDMETDGGGWTLIASIHEDDIESKCSAKDRWSTFIEATSSNRSKTAWENYETFGDVSSCTSDDYKNQGYYSIMADDVMIWHVPNNSSVDSMRELSKARYRTKNQFLRDVGGNLFSVFEDYYSLDIKQDYSDMAANMEKMRTNRVKTVLDSRKNHITLVVNGWYSYAMTDAITGIDCIFDDKLYYPYGNMMFMFPSVSSLYGKIYYGWEMWWGEYTRQQFSTIAEATQPFMMMGAIENRYLEYSYITLHILSNQQIGYVGYDIMDNWLRMGNFTLFYRSTQYVAYPYNTVCEFHYIVYNEKEWRSSPPSAFRLYDSDISTSSRRVGYIVEGYPTNIVMGYLLLARNSSAPIYKSQLDEVARIVLEAITELPDLFDGRTQCAGGGNSCD